MTNPIEPVTAWAAVASCGVIALATVRDTRHAAKCAVCEIMKFGSPKPFGWKAAAEMGWTIRQVEIRVKEEG